MFVVAAAVAIAAFVLSWFIRELPLRETVTTGDMSDTFAVPREADSLAEIANKIGQLDRREGAREIVRRVAVRADVDLSPAACWLLARYHEDATTELDELARRIDIDAASLARARDELEERRLVVAVPGPPRELRAHRRGRGDAAPAHGHRRTADWLTCSATGAPRSTRSWRN